MPTTTRFPALTCSVAGCAHPVFVITPTLAKKLPARSVLTRCAGCTATFCRAELSAYGLCAGCEVQS